MVIEDLMQVEIKHKRYLNCKVNCDRILAFNLINFIPLLQSKLTYSQ